jgi:nickel transport protein
MILGQAYFVGGAKANGATIIISDAEGRELARLKPYQEGNFSHRVARRMDYRVVADSGDGHQASWTLRADEFSPGLPGAVAAQAPASEQAAQGNPDAARARDNGQSVLGERLERAVARQIRPLREALQTHEERIRLRDILGGIGYIIGLAGLALWWSGRRRGGNG